MPHRCSRTTRFSRLRSRAAVDRHRGFRRTPGTPLHVSVDGIETAVAVRTRGKSRVELCNFPPLRLNFSSDQAEGTVFAGQDKLKLVTHCRRSGDYQKNVIEEYAAYRIMNVLTDVSLRVRLLRVGYVDTEKPGRDPDVHFAFVIEADESLVARLGASMLKVPHVTKGMFNAEHAALGFVFQYLIGNTDWSFVRVLDDEHCCHNGKLISIGEQSYYLPYDFDMSGLVDARHARPNPRLKLKSVTVRRYRGYCTDQAILRGAIRAVLRQREPILDVIAGLPGLRQEGDRVAHPIPAEILRSGRGRGQADTGIRATMSRLARAAR